MDSPDAPLIVSMKFVMLMQQPSAVGWGSFEILTKSGRTIPCASGILETFMNG
jgi:hypothetical protein